MKDGLQWNGGWKHKVNDKEAEKKNLNMHNSKQQNIHL